MAGGLTRIFEVLTLKWEAINMDFVVGFPRSRRQHDCIWVIMDIFTKSAHVIPVLVSLRFLISPYFVAISWLCIVIML